MVQPFLPNKADAFTDEQSYPDSIDFDILNQLGNSAPTGVVSGCAVTESGTPAQTVDVAAGVVRLNGKPITVGADTGVSVTAADGTNPRIDIVSVNSSGTVVVTAGTPAAAATVEAPAVPATSVVLAFLYVPANDNTHHNAQIVDKRRYVESHHGIHNVLWYDATGDGVADDTAEIQAALTAADTAGGGTVYLPPGDYKITTTLAMAAGVSLVGAGARATAIVNETASTVWAIKVDHDSTVGLFGKIADLKIEAKTAGNSGILLEDTYGYTCDSVYVELGTGGSNVGDYGFAIRYGTSGAAYNRINRCYTQGAAVAGYHIDGGAADWANRNWISESWCWDSTTGVLLADCGTNVIDIKVEGTVTAVDLGNSSSNFLNLIAEGGTTALDMGSGQTHVIEIISGDDIDVATATRCIISGSWLDANVTGSFADGEHIVSKSGASPDTRLLIAPEVQQPAMRQAIWAGLSDSWPVVSDEAECYIDFGNIAFAGTIEVEISGRRTTGNAIGIIRKQFSFIHILDSGSFFETSTSEVTMATGNITDKFTIGEPEIHTTNHFRIPIYRLDTTTTSPIQVRVRILYPSPTVTDAQDVADAITLTTPVNAVNTEVAAVVTANNGDAVLAGTTPTGLDSIGNAATGARIDFQNSDVIVYDGDNAKRIEVLNGSDIILYDEDGTTARLTWDEAGGTWDFNASIDLGGLTMFGVNNLWSTDTGIIIQATDSGVQSRGIQFYASNAGSETERLALSGAGDIVLKAVNGSTVVAQWDESEARFVLPQPVVANQPTRYTTTQVLTQADRLVNADGTAFTVTLPALSTLDLPHSILIYAGGSGNITVAPNAADNIDGAGTSKVLTGGETPPAAIALVAYDTTDDWETVSEQGTVT